MTERNIYLSNTPLEEAQAQYMSALRGLIEPRYETVKVESALNRVTKSAVYARCSSPHCNVAAMDGIAVAASATRGARETAPMTLTRGRDFASVNTGDPVRPPYDAVIMAEDAVETGGDTVQIMSAAAPWQYVRPIGEDIVAGEMLLPGSHKIRPVDIGALLSGGITCLEVCAKPRVAIFPTGNEIVEPGETLKAGQVIESNSRMLAAMVNQAGGEGERFAPVPDNFERLKQAVGDAVSRFDMVLVCSGSSAGTEDYTVHVLRDLGEVIVHGVAVKPGKPVILAVIAGKPVIGVPGYPVSAYIAFENFAAPVLSALCGRHAVAEPLLETDVVIAKRIVSSLKHMEYVRVKVGRVDGRLVASPLARGAGAAMSLVRADGFCVIERNSEGIEAGNTARVRLYRPMSEIERTAVCIGSHDVILDVLADLMASHGVHLASAHVGSMSGLMALKRGEAHLSPIHLLDEGSGTYNTPYVRQIFAAEPMSLVKGVGRIQGLIVKPGNPLGVRTVEDLARKGVRYVNRQRGSGTRILLDYRLKQAAVSPEQIDGYDREASTHMAVAAAVGGANADVGLGVLSAAKALALDFVPLGEEEYDFVIPERFLELPQIQAFIGALQSVDFHARLGALGGYTFERCGEVTNIG